MRTKLVAQRAHPPEGRPALQRLGRPAEALRHKPAAPREFDETDPAGVRIGVRPKAARSVIQDGGCVYLSPGSSAKGGKGGKCFSLTWIQCRAIAAGTHDGLNCRMIGPADRPGAVKHADIGKPTEADALLLNTHRALR